MSALNYDFFIENMKTVPPKNLFVYMYLFLLKHSRIRNHILYMQCNRICSNRRRLNIHSNCNCNPEAIANLSAPIRRRRASAPPHLRPFTIAAGRPLVTSKLLTHIPTHTRHIALPCGQNIFYLYEFRSGLVGAGGKWVVRLMRRLQHIYTNN